MRRKVLIIDDNLSILEYLKALLRKYDFDIQTCTNGYDGLHLAAKFKPDIILLDLMMPSIDGLKLLKLKKELNDIKYIPVIVISANTSRKNLMAAIEAGADRVLAKPLEVRLLQSAINELLEGKYFDTEIRVSSDSEIQEEKIINQFDEKFKEYKSNLLDSINNRDSESIKKIISVLMEYESNSNSNQYKLLHEIKERNFFKPSDWIYAEMKVKELEKLINETVKLFN